jgi:hypothetical protein
MILPRFVQNLAVTPLVLVGLEEARIAKSCSRSGFDLPVPPPGYLGRGSLGDRGFLYFRVTTEVAEDNDFIHDTPERF